MFLRGIPHTLRVKKQSRFFGYFAHKSVGFILECERRNVSLIRKITDYTKVWKMNMFSAFCTEKCADKNYFCFNCIQFLLNFTLCETVATVCEAYWIADEKQSNSGVRVIPPSPVIPGELSVRKAWSVCGNPKWGSSANGMPQAFCALGMTAKKGNSAIDGNVVQACHVFTGVRFKIWLQVCPYGKIRTKKNPFPRERVPKNLIF